MVTVLPRGIRLREIRFSSRTLLHHPCANAITSIAVEASDVGLGAQLEQLHKDKWVPIAFFSRKLSSAERNCDAFDRELLAAYAAIRHFRHFVEAKPFTVYTDHKPLTFAFEVQQTVLPGNHDIFPISPSSPLTFAMFMKNTMSSQTLYLE